ncbi:MAG: ketoglutarate semialdehyde dehydrogenase [Caulobacteraceae bacterium]|nr:ketoglutarate semialdehyde dehydrogenase [Caulobacteraceae bacterium]
MTQIRGELLIGGLSVFGTDGLIHGINPADGARLEPAFGGATRTDVDTACALAEAVFDPFRQADLATRALLLITIAGKIEALGDALIERAVAETGLPRGRIEGERGRTTGQLRLFADIVRSGDWIEPRIDPAMPDRTPLPRSDLRQRHIPLGPVAVFGASNFPLAFSVAGGDTVSALAAGCPVVVKAHSAHPGTSELVGRAIQAAVEECGLPAGVFSLLFGKDNAVGSQLVGDPRIKAVGFTGSRGGGLALLTLAAARPEPIPVYAEMSSINPMLILPHALAARGRAIAEGFVGSLTLGSGQFCTNPGLVLLLQGEAGDDFMATAAEEVRKAPSTTMLTPAIHAAFEGGVRKMESHPQVATVAAGAEGGVNQGRPALFSADAERFLIHPELADEIFGAASLVVRCASVKAMQTVLSQLEGQLTVTLQMDHGDLGVAQVLMPLLERKAGRILVNGFPTGVEVGHAMVHGGPYPATSDGRSTSVGALAIRRFLRPVCYQDFPPDLLPSELADGNPSGLWRRVDGVLGKD